MLTTQKPLLIGSLLLCSGAQAAAITAEEIQPMHIAAFKSSLLAGCQHKGQEQGDPAARVNVYCACSLSRLEQTMDEQELKTLIAYGINQRNLGLNTAEPAAADKLRAIRSYCRK